MDRRRCGIALLIVLAACTPDAPDKNVPQVRPPAPTLPPTPLFDPDSAFKFVAAQVEFGPRVPGSDAHRACGDHLVEKLQGFGATVTEQIGSTKVFNGRELPLRNIIAQFEPIKKKRILLFAHWDTRPFADKDTERKNEPIDGANDGGSGVGILLEIARQLHLNPMQASQYGIDIILFDIEDYGQPSDAMGAEQQSNDTWCLGSQYWTRNLIPAGYTAEYGILLDMCGARDAKFYQEAISMQQAPHIVRKVWKTAEKLGHGDRFVNATKYYVGIDDHVIVTRELKIPTIDIIEYHASNNGFHPSWHTHADNMDVIDPATLKAVGQTVLEVVWKTQ